MFYRFVRLPGDYGSVDTSRDDLFGILLASSRVESREHPPGA